MSIFIIIDNKGGKIVIIKFNRITLYLEMSKNNMKLSFNYYFVNRIKDNKNVVRFRLR